MVHAALFAQTHEMKFEHLTVEDGLSSLTPFHVAQDAQGFLWIAAEDGLNRYDGYTFHIYRSDPDDSTSLSRNLSTGIALDFDGTFWVATQNDILQKYDPDKDSFVRHKIVRPPAPQFDYRLSIGGISPDSGGTLWVGSNSGLCRFDSRTNQAKFFHHDQDNPASLSSNIVQSLASDNRGTVWVACSNGINALDKTTGAIRRYRPGVTPGLKPEHDNVVALTVDSSGTLWLATFAGLLRFDRREERFRPVRHKTVSGLDLGTEVFVNSVYVDNKGVVWAGTFRDGLFKIDPATRTISQYVHDAANPKSLSDNRITSIFQDRSDVLWVGTYRVGLNKYDRRRDQFVHFTTQQGVFAIREDSRGDLWFGTFGKGIRIYPKNGAAPRDLLPDPVQQGRLRGPEVYSFSEDVSGDMWVATNAGIERYIRRLHRFRQYPHPSRRTPVASPTVKVLHTDRDGELWAGTFVPSLLRYDRARDAFVEYVHNPKNPRSLPSGEIWSVFQDRKGRVWAGSFSGGVSFLDKKTNSFTTFTHDENNPSTFPVDGVYAITEDEEGNMWFGTVGGGLVRFDDGTGNYRQYTVRNGLADNFVKTVVADGKGNLWLGTDKGISVFHRATETFKNLKEKDGLHANIFLSGAAFRSHTGRLYFGGERGVTAFHPDSLRPKNYKPPVVLTRFHVFDKPYPLARSIMFRPSIELRHDEHTFSFEFVALDYSLPDKNQYAYMLEGLDKDWVLAGTRRYANYTHVPPGVYTFRVRGSNSDGVWNDEEASVPLTIAPPFWETWWFRIATVLLLVAIGAALYNYRVNRLLEIERLRVRIASDLHDDIGSSLTKISLQSELIQEGFDPDERENYLKNIASMSRELVTSMSDIVWSIDARNDTIESLLDKMRSFASGTLAAKDIGFTFSHSGLDVKKKVPVDVRENLYLIFKEAVNNIAKHAGAGSVNVVLRNDTDAFRMIVVDDGKGWEGHARPSGHGTKNMKMRAERLGGVIEFVRDEGTRVVLTIRKI